MKSSILIGIIFLASLYGQAQNLNALKFDGIDDYVNLNVIQDIMYDNKNEFTIEFWMKGDKNLQTSSIRTTMFSINEPTGENRLLFIMGGQTTQDGKLMIYPDGSWGTGAIYTSTQIIGDGQCHHIAYSYDDGNCKVYIDGVLVDTHSANCPITSEDRYSLGQEYDNLNTSQFYNGELDDFRIWSVVRSDAEIQANMNTELSGYEPSLIVYYDFNQGIPDGLNTSINFLDDKTASNLNGDLFNFTLNYSASNWIRGLCVASFVDIIKELKIKLNVYPNPCSNYVVITGEFNQVDKIEFSLVDLKGRTVLVFQSDNSDNISQYMIEIPSIPSGKYFLNCKILGQSYSLPIEIIQ